MKLNRYGNPVTDELQYAINGEETEEKLKANENGEYVFQLEGDQSITIFGIKHNTQYEVQENVDGDKYQTVYGKLESISRQAPFTQIREQASLLPILALPVT